MNMSRPMCRMFSQMPTHPFQRCQPCARPHSAGSVPPAPPLTSPQAPQNARLMTALHSVAVLRPSTPFRPDIRLAERNIQSSPPPGHSPSGRLQHQSGIGRAGPSLQRGFRRRLHPRLRSVLSPPMPSYFGPGRLAAFSAAAYSVPQPSLAPIPLRSIPVPSGLHYARSAPNPTRLPDGPQSQRCSLRSPVAKEFTRLPGHPGAHSIKNEHIKDSKIRAVSNSLPPSHTAGPAPLQPPDSRHLRNIIQP